MARRPTPAFVRWRALAPALACPAAVTQARSPLIPLPSMRSSRPLRPSAGHARAAGRAQRAPAEAGQPPAITSTTPRGCARTIERGSAAGIRDYLTPQTRTAQRDPTTLIGDSAKRRRTRHDERSGRPPFQAQTSQRLRPCGCFFFFPSSLVRRRVRRAVGCGGIGALRTAYVPAGRKDKQSPSASSRRRGGDFRSGDVRRAGRFCLSLDAKRIPP